MGPHELVGACDALLDGWDGEPRQPRYCLVRDAGPHVQREHVAVGGVEAGERVGDVLAPVVDNDFDVGAGDAFEVGESRAGVRKRSSVSPKSQTSGAMERS